MVDMGSFRKQVCELARQHGVSRVVLFGSALREPDRARDIDLGVRGVPDGHFFSFYGDVLAVAPCDVDLVDLDRDSRFTRLVESDGEAIYEHS